MKHRFLAYAHSASSFATHALTSSVDANTKEECEGKLVVMIKEVKREIEQQKQKIQQQSQSEMVMQ